MGCLSKLGGVAPGFHSVDRPEARRIRREHLIGQDEIAVDQPELELGVGDDDPAAGGQCCGALVDVDADVSDRACEFGSDQADRVLEGDVDVMVADVGFGRRREDRFRQL